ncbi:MAG: hypothetical protein VKS61_02840 [Candidatus Sericytochromatia bacterium]|nr:hypothetical protein [Candidatus Sericytochromatia bacterium]
MSDPPLAPHPPDLASEARPDASDERRLSLGGFNVVLLLFGSLLNLVAYQTAVPLLVGAILLTGGVVSLLLPKWGGREERRIFIRLFCVYWVMAGVAAIYASNLGDYMQLNSDPGGFHEISAYKARGFRLEELRLLTEGSLAVVVWASAYDLFAELGIERERYVGILINVLAGGFTGVLALKMARHIFGEDLYRFRRLTWLLGSCGLLWLFAGIHLRDGMVLLGVTALAWAWVRFVSRPNTPMRLVQVTVATLVSLLLLPFLRAEFFYVPFAFAIAATISLILGIESNQGRLVARTLAALGFVCSLAYLLTAEESLQETFLQRNEAYTEGMYEQHGADSLGTAMIVGQSLPLRLLLGSAYLYVFPIPAWGGFQLESAYNLFKSINVLFFYVVLPFVGLGIWQLWREPARRKPGLIFCLVVIAGFTLGIAGTSLENRHLGAFFVPLFLLALVPDTRDPVAARLLQRILFVTLAAMVVVHLLWATLKFA